MNWVTHQVVNHNIDAAIIKSDSKICVDKGGAKGGREEAIAPLARTKNTLTYTYYNILPILSLGKKSSAYPIR